MGRAGGGGGRGRVSGGGGVRHSGGRSGGRSSFSGGNRGHSTPGGFSGGSFGSGSHYSGGPVNPWRFSGSRRMGNPFGPRPVIINQTSAPRRSGCGCGCLSGTVIFILVVVLIVVAVTSCTAFGKASSGGSTGEIRASTIRRERLNSVSLVDVGWYTDELDWIRDRGRLEKGLAFFYKRTGVSPYLYLTEDADGVMNPTADQLDVFSQDLYDKLFRDEAHFLVVFQEHNGVYNTRYVCGLEARAVMDQEACDILLDYLDAYYYGDYDDEEYFARAFTDAANRIMDTKVPARVYVTGVCVVIGIGIVVWLVLKKRNGYKAPEGNSGGDPPAEGAPDLTEELLEKADAETRSPGEEE